MRDDNPFTGKKIWIITRHRKEKAIAPVLQHTLKATCILLDDIDTDVFGTFTGEISRKGTALDAAREKCSAALNFIGYNDLVLASEGSFGPHPSFPFIALNEEWLLLKNLFTAEEWFVCSHTTKTNFASELVTSWEELRLFALRAGFPAHGLILRDPHQPEAITKGLQSWVLLKYHFRRLVKLKAEVRVETDMRAMYNPTRMEIIKRTAEKLARRLLRKCPKCKTHGFAETTPVTGLPCNLCGEPTRLTKAMIFCCNTCGYTEERPITCRKSKADPFYCDYCNP